MPLTAEEVRLITVSVAARILESRRLGGTENDPTLADDIGTLVSDAMKFSLTINLDTPPPGGSWAQAVADEVMRAQAPVLTHLITNLLAGAIIAVKAVADDWVAADANADAAAALRAAALRLAAQG